MRSRWAMLVAPVAFAGADGGIVRFNTIERPGKWALRTSQIRPPSTRGVPERWIELKGARANNLTNIDLEIPKNRLVVVTGPPKVNFTVFSDGASSLFQLPAEGNGGTSLRVRFLFFRFQAVNRVACGRNIIWTKQVL